MTIRVNPDNAGAAVLDDAHIGNIQGAFVPSSMATSRPAKPGNIVSSR